MASMPKENKKMSRLPAPLANLPLPIIGSPLFIISNPKLVIAQCKAGVGSLDIVFFSSDLEAFEPLQY